MTQMGDLVAAEDTENLVATEDTEDPVIAMVDVVPVTEKGILFNRLSSKKSLKIAALGFFWPSYPLPRIFIGRINENVLCSKYFIFSLLCLSLGPLIHQKPFFGI